MKGGVTTQIRMNVAMQEAAVCRNEDSDCGSSESTPSWSLLNRFRMRPIGVVSKKKTGARITRWIAPMWMRIAPRVDPYALTAPKTSVRTALAAPSST